MVHRPRENEPPDRTWSWRLTPQLGRTRLVTRMKQDYRWNTPRLATVNLVLMEFGDFAMNAGCCEGSRLGPKPHRGRAPMTVRAAPNEPLGAGHLHRAFVYFTGTVVYALHNNTPDFEALTHDLDSAMTVHGIAMVGAGIAVAVATFKAAVLPRWTGIALAVGVTLVALTLGLGAAIELSAAGIIRDVAFVGMGLALVRSATRATAMSPTRRWRAVRTAGRRRTFWDTVRCPKVVHGTPIGRESGSAPTPDRDGGGRGPVRPCGQGAWADQMTKGGWASSLPARVRARWERRPRLNIACWRAVSTSRSARSNGLVR